MNNLKPSQVRLLFASTCVNERLCRKASKILREDDFGYEYAIYRFVLDVLLEYFDLHKRIPPPGVLRSNLLADLLGSEAATEADEQELGELYQLILVLQNEDPGFVFSAVSDFMNQFKEHCLRQKFRDKAEAGDLGEVLRESQLELRQALVSDTDKFANPLGESFDNRKPGKFMPIGNPLFDMFTGGTGPATGDVVGHAAPSGGGKSTLSSQVALATTMLELAKAKVENRRPGVTYIINYEQVLDPMTHVLANGAKVPRETIELYLNSPAGTSVLSTGRNYKKYELKWFKRQLALADGKKFPYPLAERERIDKLRKQLADSLYIVDFSGSRQDLAKYGTGFVDGALEFIEEHQLSMDRPGVTAVHMDYASAMARLYLGRPGRRNNQDTEYSLLIDLSLQVKHKITVPLRCYSLLSQQLAADEGARAGGTRAEPSKFKGCKAFGENCDFAYVNGKRTEDTNLAIFSQSKIRRGLPQADIIGKLDGKFSNWQPATGDLTIAGNRIVERTEAMKLAGARNRIARDIG